MPTGAEHYRDAERSLERAHHYIEGDGANPAVGAAFAAQAQAHAMLAALAQPMVWTDPATAVPYDLTRQYRDVDGDVWVPVGWLHRFGGDPVPVLNAVNYDDMTDVELPTVLKDYGPLNSVAESETEPVADAGAVG